MSGCFPFLSFLVSLVGVGFGLDVLDDLGNFANTSATYRETTSSYMSISYAGSSTTLSVIITSSSVDITLSSSARIVSSKFENSRVSLKV